MGPGASSRRIVSILKALVAIISRIWDLGIWKRLRGHAGWIWCYLRAIGAQPHRGFPNNEGGSAPTKVSKGKDVDGTAGENKPKSRSDANNVANQTQDRTLKARVATPTAESTLVPLRNISCSHLPRSPYMNANRNFSSMGTGDGRENARNAHLMGVIARRTRVSLQLFPTEELWPTAHQARQGLHVEMQARGPSPDRISEISGFEAGLATASSNRREKGGQRQERPTSTTSATGYRLGEIHEPYPPPGNRPERGDGDLGTGSSQDFGFYTTGLPEPTPSPGPDPQTGQLIVSSPQQGFNYDSSLGWTPPRMGQGARQAPSIANAVRVPQLGNERIYPLMPESFRRYDRTAFASKDGTEVVIPAFTLDFKDKPDPQGWKPILHPEGVLYWYNEAKRAVTEANLHDERFFAEATQSISIIEAHVLSSEISLPKNCVLALDLNFSQSRASILTGYYFVDNDRKVIFFLDDVNASVHLAVWPEVKGVTSLNHIRHEIEAQYWIHGVLYPSTIPMAADRVNELRDTILHYIGDFTNSAYSTSPYSLGDLNTMLGQVNAIKKSVGSCQGAAGLLSRMNLVFARSRFYNWHGLPEVRIYRDMSVHQRERGGKSWLIKILSPLLFSAPDTHLKTFEKIWVDGIMHQSIWLESINKLSSEWTEFILYAAILLTANVAFIAIQSVENEKSQNIHSPVLIACYLSIVASIGSIVLGLLLLRQTRTRANESVTVILEFLRARSHPTLGMETLAIVYSLPFSLLMWGMVSFIVGFAWSCFDTSTTATRIVMSVAWAAFMVLVMWCVWMGWVNFDSIE